MDEGLRASDADRDRAAAQLQIHFAAGRLGRGELEDRLTAALRAVTIGDLHRVLADLPELAPAPRRYGSLERGYRRLLAFYPPAYRRVHGEEMLAVLLTAAPEGKLRPGLAEAADLIAGAVRVWCQPSHGRVGRRGVLALARAGAVLGLLAGTAYTAVNPPLPTSKAFVIVMASAPRHQFIGRLRLGFENTQVVLARAAPAVRSAMSEQALRSAVQISHECFGHDPESPVSCNIAQISAQAATAGQADRAASAVAHSYAAYVGLRNSLWVVPASVVSGTSLLLDALETGGLGALVGATGAAALGSPGRRFRMT